MVAVKDLGRVELSDHLGVNLIEGREEDEWFPLGHRFYGVLVIGFCDLCDRRRDLDA